MFNLNYLQNSLQAVPFHDLDDREFHILNGSCHLQIDNLKNYIYIICYPTLTNLMMLTLIIY